MFIGREDELRRINDHIKLDTFNAILVYGRRRIGKTELINEALNKSGNDTLRLLARNVETKLNLEDFSKQASLFMGIQGFHPNDFYEFFSALIEYSKSRPFILFVDEYSFLKNDDNDIDSNLQKAIELHKKGAKITIILCGSYIEIMKQIVEYDSPLYGRFNEIILLHSFNYFDSSKFLEGLSNEDKIKYYSIFGGVAFNLINIDKTKTFEDILINNFIKPDSFFENEVLITLRKEIGKESKLNTIFELIASGKKTYKEINEYFKDSSKDNCVRYLKKLESLDLIDKRYSITDKNSKKPIYYIKDKLISFYYTYLFKNEMYRRMMEPSVFYENLVKPTLFSKYIPHKFEEIVKEYCIKENGKKVPLFFNASNLTFNKTISGKMINREFDLVLDTSEGLIPTECKYKDRPLTLNEINEEIESWKDLPFKIYKYGFASKSGFTKEVKDIKDLILIDLDDLFE